MERRISYRLSDRMLTLLAWIFLAIWMCITAAYHEPWADEAQSWLLARDSGLWELLAHNLRYEGTPGLWHVLLMPITRLFGYAAMQVLSVLLALAGAALLMFRSPFPLWIRLTLPFTFFLCYQYGVIARNYCLLAPLLFALAALHEDRYRRPVLWGGLLLLLANVSLHGSLIAGTILVFHVFTDVQSRKTLSDHQLRSVMVLTGAFAVMTALIILQLWPPDDLSFSDRAFAFNGLHFLTTAKQVIAEVFTGIPALSWIVFLLSLVVFFKRGYAAFFLTGTILLTGLFSIYYQPWHQGALFIFWLYTLWIAFPVDRPGDTEAVRWRGVAVLALTVVLGVQLFWSAEACRNDHRAAYSASRELAGWLKARDAEHKVVYARQFWPVSVLPYFEENIYMNHRYREGRSFWTWTKSNDWIAPTESILALDPDILIFPKPHLYDTPGTLDGYLPPVEFTGRMFWKTDILEEIVYRVFERDKESAALRNDNFGL